MADLLFIMSAVLADNHAKKLQRAAKAARAASPLL
jgi:hypothetical protein